MAKINESEIIKHLLIKRDVSFINYKEDAVKVDYDEKLLVKYFSVHFEDEHYGSEVRHKILDYYNPAGTKLTEDDYIEYYSSPFVSKNLFNNTDLILQDAGINNLTVLGTICIALLKFLYWLDSYKDNDSSDETRKERKLSAEFFSFLEKYQKGEIDIKEIRITSKTKSENGKFTLKNLNLPIHWFEAFYNNYMHQISTIMKQEKYLQSMKNQSLNWLKAHPKSSNEINLIIRAYTKSFDKLMEHEFKIKTKHKRHKIIGQLFSEIKVLPSKEEIKKIIRGTNYSENEYLADRIRQFISQGKKDKIHTLTIDVS